MFALPVGQESLPELDVLRIATESKPLVGLAVVANELARAAVSG